MFVKHTIRQVVVNAESKRCVTIHKIITAGLFIVPGGVSASAACILLVILAALLAALDGVGMVSGTIPMV